MNDGVVCKETHLPLSSDRQSSSQVRWKNIQIKTLEFNKHLMFVILMTVFLFFLPEMKLILIHLNWTVLKLK